jgi:AraC-like DNA-binding protein
MYRLIEFIIAFGAFQGIIVSMILAIKGLKAKQENIYLSLVLLGFAAILVRVLVISVYQGQSSFFIHLNFILLISPALYLYMKESLSNIRNTKFNLYHFLPFLFVNIGYVLFYYSFNASIEYQINLQSTIKINEGISIVYFVVYLYLTSKFLYQNKSSYSKGRYNLLYKLNLIFLIFFIIWIVYILAELIYFQYYMELVYYYPIMVLLAIILYYLSLQVLIHSQFLPHIKETFKRKTFVLSENDSIQLLNKLNILMEEEKPFLNDGISMSSLADSIGTNPKTLSFIINEYAKKNYNDYINAWRIKEVKTRLNNKKYKHYKMLAIAYDCGFNSKSTFNLAFKKATGISPSKYKSLLKS